MKYTSHFFVIPFLLAVTVCSGFGGTSTILKNAGQSPDSGHFQMINENQRLTISAVGTVLNDILLEIALEFNIELRMYGVKNEKVIFSCKQLTVEEALKKLLRNKNYALIYSTRKDPTSGTMKILVSGVDIIETSEALKTAVPDASDPAASGHFEVPDKLKSIVLNQNSKNHDQLIDLIQNLSRDGQPKPSLDAQSMAEEIKHKIETGKERIIAILEQSRKDRNPNLRVKNIETF